MDEISKETNKINQPGGPQKYPTNTLLWMDDVVLMADNPRDMEMLLKTTYEVASRYRIVFGKEKSNTMIVKKNLTRHPQTDFCIGQIPLQHTHKYKYLGYTISDTNSPYLHLKTVNGKAEMAYQTILSILYNREFSGIQMKLIWRLIETCVIPVITYASETWSLNKRMEKTANDILDNILRRILMTPGSTPREALH